MKINKNAFTLIEMIVWVGLTMVLMISIWIFVSSGMANITIQKQILDQSSEIWNLWETLNNIFAQNSEIITNSATSILVKSNYVLWHPTYYNIKIITSTWYCENELNRENKYLEIKNFNPFILTGATYSGSYIDNVIYSGWQIIAGKWVFWDNFVDGSIGTGMYINNPAWIAYWSWKLYISDSGNNRIVYMSWSKMYKLLDIDDGIYNPTGLFYTGSELYILNSGKNELLKLTSKSNSSATWNPIDIKFKPSSIVNSVKKIEIEILPNDFILTGTYNSGSFNFTWFSKNISWDVWWTGVTNKLLYTLNTTKNFVSWTTYNIKVDIQWILDSWITYYLKLNLLDASSNILYEKYYSYVVNGDNDLITMNDNTLVTVTWSISSNFTEIKYVDDLAFLWKNIVLNNYIDEEMIVSKPDFTSCWPLCYNTLPIYNIDDFESIKQTSDFKVKDFSITNDGKILTMKLEYYKIFSCYNDKDSVTKTILLKKAISN